MPGLRRTVRERVRPLPQTGIFLSGVMSLELASHPSVFEHGARNHDVVTRCTGRDGLSLP
jgi:hypothetical protein